MNATVVNSNALYQLNEIVREYTYLMKDISIFVPSHFFLSLFFHISYHLVINISIISFRKDLVDYCIKAQNVMRSA